VRVKIQNQVFDDESQWQNFQMESEDEESVTGSEEEVRMVMNFGCFLIIQKR
jgi:hypothetical protein